MSVIEAPAPARAAVIARLAARNWGAYRIAAIVVLLLAVLPLIGLSEYSIGLLTSIAIYSSVTLAWSFVMGHAGILTFGSLAFFAIGGYTAAILTTKTDVSPWLGFLAAGMTAGIAGLAVGLPSLRLYGPYMVLFTLCFHMMIQVLVGTDTSGFTGGALGITDIPALTLPGISDPLHVGYYLGWALTAVTFVVIAVLLGGPVGRALKSLRDDEAAAVARGVPLVIHRQIAFVVSSMLLGLAGAFYATYYGYISPVVLSFGLLMNLFAMVVVGGLRSRVGPIVGTAFLVYLGERLQAADQYRNLVWGAIVLATVMWMRKGLAPTLGLIFGWARKRLTKWIDEEPEARDAT